MSGSEDREIAKRIAKAADEVAKELAERADYGACERTATYVLRELAQRIRYEFDL